MSHQEEKISKFLDYPYDSFLMLRLEFMLIFKDELIAKVLRIIEKEIETERKRLYRETVNKMGTTPTGVVDITKDIYVTISYKTFMSDLFDTVTSENTLKRAIKELERMKVIFRRHDQKKRYDAPEYTIHQPVLQMLLSLLKKPGYQNLIPSAIETLKNLHPHKMTPSECQLLIPSIEELSTKPETRVSNFDPNYNNSNTNNSNNKEITYAVLSDDKNSDTPSPFSLEDMIAQLQASGYTISQDETQATTKEDTNGNSDLMGRHRGAADDGHNDAVQSQLAPLADQVGATANERESIPSGIGSHTTGDTHGQPADTMTPQVADNDGRETPVPLQAKSGTDLPAHSLDRLSASTGDTPSQASRIANVTPTTDEKQTTLSRSGENATTGDGVQTPPESGAKGKGKGKQPASNIIELIPEQEERAKAWGPRIDKWRGYALETKGAVVNEKQCIRKLVKRYTDEQIKRVYVYLFKKHWRWSKAENRYKIGANEVWQEASAVLQELEGTVPAELNEMQQPGKPADAKSIMDALTATSSYQPLQFASRPARKAQ